MLFCTSLSLSLSLSSITPALILLLLPPFLIHPPFLPTHLWGGLEVFGVWEGDLEHLSEEGLREGLGEGQQEFVVESPVHLTQVKEQA